MPKSLTIVRSKNSDKLMNSMFDPIFKSIVQNPEFRKLLSLIISHVTIYSPGYKVEKNIIKLKHAKGAQK